MSELNIRELRQRLGVTQKKLAQMVGVSENTVQNWEYGRRIPATKHQILRTLMGGNCNKTTTTSMDIRERMAKLLEYSGLSASAFGKEIGVKTKQAIYELLKGNTKSVSPSMASKIVSRYPEISQAWLLTGEGDMLNHSVVVQPMGIKERVLSVADTKGIEPSSLEGILGVSGNYFRNTESVSAEPLAKLITIYPDINADWLLTGRGSMFRAEPSSSPWESLVKAVAEELKKTSEPNG